jgi:hypothetical protein
VAPVDTQRERERRADEQEDLVERIEQYRIREDDEEPDATQSSSAPAASRISDAAADGVDRSVLTTRSYSVGTSRSIP